MAFAIRDKALVVIQLSGGNDCLNTVVPYTNGLYYDFRPTVNIAAEDVLPIMMPSASIRAWDPSNVCGMRGKSRLSTASAIRAPIAPTSGRWTSGTPLSPRKLGKRAG